MSKQIDDLRHGKDVQAPIYDYKNHTRSKDTLLVKSSPIIIIDGILIFYDKSLRDMMDLKIFVETDADERILRRAKRDMMERGRTIDSIIDQYLATVKPMHNQYVEPTKKFADIVIYGGKSEIVLDLVCSKINAFLSSL
jgi:uridine kinase